MMQFAQLVSVNFQGTVVVFGRPAGGVSTDIHFNVLGTDTQANDDSLNWSGFTKLAFPNQVRQVGMGIITLTLDAVTMQPSPDPFRVVTDQKYISVIQQSLRGTLYVNRFRLLKSKSGTDQKTTLYTLDPAWEVRYSRSHKEDVPADSSDTQGYLDPDGTPFLEPSLELSMVTTVRQGAFEVVLLPVSGRESLAWQFVLADPGSQSLHFYHFPGTEAGLMDVTGKAVGPDYKILPDSTCTFTVPPAPAALPLQGPPRACVYVKHEQVVQPDGSSLGVKRATRVMVSQPVLDGATLATVTVDSAVSPNGTLATLTGAVAAGRIEPALFDLVFNGVSWLRLTPPAGANPLAIAGPYALSFLIAPSALGDGVWVMGGDLAADPKTAAPFVRLVDGDKLEIGFGNGSAAVACRTLHPVVFRGVWSSIEIVYAGKGTNPFTVRLNGSVVALSACATDREPCGTPVSQIGAADKGFAGALSSLALRVGVAEVLTVPCAAVDYTVTPPTTPNTAPSGVTVQVFGPRNEPSSSPVNVDQSGAFAIDATGLTYYTALASFLQPQGPACLIDGSDGLLHLYYPGRDQQLSVAQFSTAAARATFSVAWSTLWSGGARAERLIADDFSSARYLGREVGTWRRVSARVLGDGEIQTGFVNFVAHRVGTYMNPTRITVAASAVSPLLCDVTVEGADTVGRETWRGLPRAILQLASIWNGAGANSPDAQAVQAGRTVYYDYAASLPAVLAPCAHDIDGGYFLFVSVPGQPVHVEAVTVSEEGGAGVTLTIEVSAPPNWATSDRLLQSWPRVPATARGLKDVLAGKAGAYNYGAVTTPGTRAYGLEVSTGRSDAALSHVLLFIKDSLVPFALSVSEGTLASTCRVVVGGFTLPDVPRDQGVFATVLNGLSDTYPYPQGYKAEIAAALFALTDGLSGAVLNTTGSLKEAGAFAYAGLMRVLYQGGDDTTAVLAAQARTPATIFQGATLDFKGRRTPLAGSMMFGLDVSDPPTDGGVGRLADTAGYTNGVAPLLTPGKNGGWMRVAPKFSLAFNTQTGKAGYVGFTVDRNFTPANQLAIDGDLTLQGWLKPKTATGALQARALTYAVTGNQDHPDLPLQYMLGSMRGPGVLVGTGTWFSRSINFQPPSLTVQIYVKLGNASAKGTVWKVLEVRGSAEYLALTINATARPVLTFLKTGGSVTGASALPANAWVCLTATVAPAADGKVSLSLFTDAAAPVTTTVANTFTGSLGTLRVGNSGGGDGLSAATLNGVAFWQRALSATEVQNSVLYGFPDNDPLLGIRWNLAEGQGTVLMNAAATGADYDTTLTNPVSPSWDVNGAFDVPYAGRNELVLASNRILKGWTNVALASRQGHGLRLNGSASGVVKDGSAFNPGNAFALEAWIAPTALNARQTLLEKPGSYSLFVSSLGQLVLRVTVAQNADRYDLPPVSFTHELSAPLPSGQTSYVAVNFITGNTADLTGSTQFVSQKYYIYSSIFINGVLVKENNKTDYAKAITVQNQKASFYLGVSGDATFHFAGLMSHARVWSRTLSTLEIARTQALRQTPDTTDGLIASWDFDDASGTVAKDLTGNNDLQLSSNQLWTIWQDVSQASIIVNGRDSLPQRLQPADVGGYQDPQFVWGGVLSGGTLTNPFSGELDDIRLYATLLTAQQVRESMNKALTGMEERLAGYWAIDAGSGPVVYDLTGHGNTGRLLPTASPPLWQASSAPIQNEGQEVVNALGGVADYRVARIDGQPSVIEYASAETDAYGAIFSVMKRGYFYRATVGETELAVGYKVGDLDTIYVGQVQSKPTIIGYIEGGPPIPSENQTLASWFGAGGGPDATYASASSVVYQESETKTWSFSAAQSSTYAGSFNLKGGFYLKSKSEVSVGVGAEAETQVLETTVKLGAVLALSGEIGGTDEVAQRHANTLALSTSLTPAGSWERADALLNPVVGRRYLQDNVGMALVKSATADLYMLALKGTQTPVGYALAPNPLIPVDTNIIDFPINPKYIKNGTLDGKVGLVNDPDYPNANAERGSYFKPLEAYNTKRRIEKQEQQIKAYYDQFDVNKYRVVGQLGNVKDKLKENTAYGFSGKTNLRSLYCNYVWTAAGGLHKEEYSVANSYSETYTGASSLTFALGLEASTDIGTPFGGYYLEGDTLHGNTWTMTATKNEESANSFQLGCLVAPTNFLPAPLLATGPDGDLLFKGYASAPAPGKVDAYRYMAFLLAPAAENFTALKGVVDPHWLANSNSAAANAMREALGNSSQPWRIFYRTTYVSRVPADFQPVRDNTQAPNIIPPANLPSNCWLVAIVADLLDHNPTPTPLEIGNALDAVLGAPGAGPGLLKTLIPWWETFYTAAQVYGTAPFRELAQLRVDLLDYMISKYEAERYALG